MSGPVVVRLSRPLQAIDRTFTELTLREPTGEDLEAAGYPLTFDGSGGGKVDVAAMSVLIGVIAGVPKDSVRKMPIGDWSACMRTVMGFFGDGLPSASSTPITSAPDGGATALNTPSA